MNQIFIPEKDPFVAEVLAAYDLPATLLGAVRYGQGHINDTFCVICQPQEGDAIRYILQGLSLAAFPHPDELMENFVGITSYLRERVIAMDEKFRLESNPGEIPFENYMRIDNSNLEPDVVAAMIKERFAL